jgi:ABC-type nickel/cobalt efflux system permease component RcnA
MVLFLTGLAASMAHVVTGPDHLAAVTPLAIDCRKKSWVVGFSWGLGHTLGMLMIGAIFLLFRSLLRVDFISAKSDIVVGFMLVGIGTWAILRTWIRHRHSHRPHPHFHTKPYLYAHIHAHSHEEHNNHDHPHERSVRQNSMAALFIGIVHGFSGFSHLVALLPSLALPTITASIIYIVAFALGTVSVMVLFAFILGFVAFQSFVRNKQAFLRWFTISGGVLAIVVGLVWVFKGLL